LRSDSRQNVLHSLEFIQISLRNAVQFAVTIISINGVWENY